MTREKRKHLKILTTDIETAPNGSWVFDLWNQNISLNQLRENVRILCFAAKWLDSDEVLFYSEFHHDADTMIQKAHELLTEADAVVTYNGDSFDLKHFNREFFVRDMAPPKPYAKIDLYKIVKQQFRFASNKLDHVAQQIDIGSKVKHAGFNLWVRCMNGEYQAWEEMKTYNMQDVLLTEDLYSKVLPWITNHPNQALFPDEEDDTLVDLCPNCGSLELRKEGFKVVQTRRYQQYQCKSCGAWSRSTRAEDGVEVRS
jgi:DNA polymerase elongation subunit (family B)